MSNAWKDAEKAVAKYLGGTRVSRGANFSESKEDVEHPLFSIEVKERKKVSKFLIEILDQADKYNNGKQISIGVLHQLGKRHDNDIVLIRLSDFAQWYNTLKSVCLSPEVR